MATTDGSTASSSGEALSGGDSGTRYLGVDVTSEAGGTLKIDAGANQVNAGVTLTNDGTLDVGVDATLNLAGGAGGEADLTDGADSTTSIALDSDTGASSVIDQLMCSDPACADESIKLDGTFEVDQSGDGTIVVYVPIFSMVTNLSGTFSVAPSILNPVYNGSGISIPGVVGSLLLTLP